MTETREPYDAGLYARYNIIARIDGFCVAEEDDHALILSDRAMPHYVVDEAASEALLKAARLIEHMRREWMEWGAAQRHPGGEGRGD